MTWPALGWAPAPGSSSQALITPFGCALRGTAAPALPLRLLLGADVFDVRLDRFFAMSSLPFLNRRRDIHRRGELAMMAASRLSLVQWRYRGELAHVSSTIRRRRSFSSAADTASLPLNQCVAPLLGKRTANTEPLPGSLVTVTSPPIMRASLREMARPSPVPP